MKTRILSVIAILVLSVTGLEAQIDFGVVAGPGFQNMVGKDGNGDKISNGFLAGFHAGITAAIPVATDFYFQSGLLFSQKGSRNNMGLITTKAADDDYHTTTRVSYLELPMNLLFRPWFAGGHILIGFGPYVAFGLGGKQTVDYETIPAMERKIKFKNQITSVEFWDMDYTYLRRFDAGAGIFAGYELEMGLWLRVNAQLGLLNMMPDIEEWEYESILKNTGFGVSVGYNF